MKIKNTKMELPILQNDYNFNYQNELTSKLDAYKKKFNQNIINEIVLWKVNRYALLNEKTLKLLNSIKANEKKINIVKTKSVLSALINTKGIQLPMASTILRFKNKFIYQIIDQRVYRLIYEGRELKSYYGSSREKINFQVDLYLKYLDDLRRVCIKEKIPFEQSDRILYKVDKRINKDKKIKNY